MKGKGVKSLNLKVLDSCFGVAKITIIHGMLSGGSIKDFVYENLSPGFDVKEDDFSNFEANMAPIMRIKTINKDITWAYRCCTGFYQPA